MSSAIQPASYTGNLILLLLDTCDRIIEGDHKSEFKSESISVEDQLFRTHRLDKVHHGSLLLFIGSSNGCGLTASTR